MRSKKSYASGRPGGNSFWGLNKVPDNAEEWRQGSAVIDEWNRDGFIVIGTILPGHTLPACTGVIAERAGDKIAVQYLTGGAKQAMLKLPADFATELGKAADKVENLGGVEVVTYGGVRWEFRATGWPDANEIHGYAQSPGPGSVQTSRLPAPTVASKTKED